MSGVIDLLERGMQLGRDALVEARRATEDVRLPTPSCGGCDIPPPCWYPKDAGRVVSHVCPGGSARLRVRITNSGPTVRRFSILVAGAPDAEVSPPQLDLGPMERGEVTVSRAEPKEKDFGEEALVWVSGCHRHFVRWTVKSSSRGTNTCHEVSISDCPNYVHHWYDHFYCGHPCPAGDDRRLDSSSRAA